MRDEPVDWRILVPRRRVARRLVFLHIPKCGGSSIVRAIHRTLPVSIRGRPVTVGGAAARRLVDRLGAVADRHDVPDMEVVRRHVFLYHLARPNTPYVGGHIPFDAMSFDAFAGKHAWITVLRDPVQRWISQYFYRKYRPAARGDLPPLDEFLATQEAADFGRFQVHFLGGAAQMSAAGTTAAVDAAKRNLDRLHVVGRLEDLDRFARRYHEVLGARLDIGWRNQNPRAKDKIRAEITEERLEAIRRLCAPDQALYDHAVACGM